MTRATRIPPFPVAARAGLDDAQQRRNLRTATDAIARKRAAVVAEVPDWQALRERGATIKREALRHLAEHLEELERSVEAAGGTLAKLSNTAAFLYKARSERVYASWGYYLADPLVIGDGSVAAEPYDLPRSFELVADDSDIVNDATVSREWNTPDASASAASSTSASRTPSFVAKRSTTPTPIGGRCGTQVHPPQGIFPL